jgi:hypothetical protein
VERSVLRRSGAAGLRVDEHGVEAILGHQPRVLAAVEHRRPGLADRGRAEEGLDHVLAEPVCRRKIEGRGAGLDLAQLVIFPSRLKTRSPTVVPSGRTRTM